MDTSMNIMESSGSYSPVESIRGSPCEMRIDSGSPWTFDFDLADSLSCDVKHYTENMHLLVPRHQEQFFSRARDNVEDSDDELLVVCDDGVRSCKRKNLQFHSPMLQSTSSPLSIDLDHLPMDNGRTSLVSFTSSDDDLSSQTSESLDDYVNENDIEFYSTLNLNQDDGVAAHAQRVQLRYENGTLTPRLPSIKAQSFSLTPYTDVAKPRKKTKSKNIRRPMNGFMIFAQGERALITAAYPSLHNANISKHLGRTWRLLPDMVRKIFLDEAKRLKALHQQEHPDYKYRPQKRRASNGKETPEPAKRTKVNRNRRRESGTRGRRRTPRPPASEQEELGLEIKTEPLSPPLIPQSPNEPDAGPVCSPTHFLLNGEMTLHSMPEDLLDPAAFSGFFQQADSEIRLNELVKDITSGDVVTPQDIEIYLPGLNEESLQHINMDVTLD